jgi:hypothetical protein
MGFGDTAVEGWPGSLADLVMVADGGRDSGRGAAVVVDSCRAGKEVGALWPEQLAPAMVEGGDAGAGRACEGGRGVGCMVCWVGMVTQEMAVCG